MSAAPPPILRPAPRIPPSVFDGSLYGRKWNLTVYDSKSQNRALVLSTEERGHDLRIHFLVKQLDNQTPNNAIITVYNLADSPNRQTARTLISEYDRVELQAGYIGGHYGVIFSGEIKQFKLGRESAIDSYLIIYAADGDTFNNQLAINASLDGPSNSQQRLDFLKSHFDIPLDAAGLLGGTNVANRPYIYYGYMVDEMRDWAKNAGCSWSVQNGRMVVTGQRQYNANEIVVLTARTGLVGVPEATDEGIKLQCLINPAIKIRGRVQLDNRSINSYSVPGGQQQSMTGDNSASAFPGWSDFHWYANTSNDGVYMVFRIDVEGDTRALPWYQMLNCFAVDAAAKTEPVQGVPVEPLDPGGSGSDEPPFSGF